MFKTGTSSLSNALMKLGYHCHDMLSEPGLSTCRYWDTSEWYEKSSNLYFTSPDDLSWMYYYTNDNDNDRQSILEHLLVNSDISYNFGDGPWLFSYHIFDQYYSVPPKQTELIDSDWNESIYGNLTNLKHGAKFILTVRSNTWNIVNSDLKMAIRNSNTAANRPRKKQGLPEIPIRS